MANARYPKASQALGAGNINWSGASWKVTLIDLADYTYSAAHEFISDVPSGARVASVALGSLTNTNGLLDAADSTFTAVSGDQSEALIIWNDTGTESTSRLLLFLDTGVTGLPVTPNGGNINITWNASGIHQI